MRACSAEEFVNLKLAGKKRLSSKHIMNNSKLIKCTLLIECMKINSEFLKFVLQGLLIFLFHCIGDEKVRNDTPNANMADLSVGPGLVARKRG